jgi:hypothetical protein
MDSRIIAIHKVIDRMYKDRFEGLLRDYRVSFVDDTRAIIDVYLDDVVYRESMKDESHDGGWFATKELEDKISKILGYLGYTDVQFRTALSNEIDYSEWVEMYNY